MKVTYNWLKYFVEINISPQSLADKLSMAGLEVTSLEKKGQDFVFEMEVTSNRPDCLSVMGIAREVAAITGRKLKLLHAARCTLHAKSLEREAWSVKPSGINIEDKKDCPLYTAKIIKDIKVGSSPEWLKKRLESIGCRSVNNIVDITNYILFEWGEPLHAFDLDKLSGSGVIVRRAKTNEKITTIDGESRTLNPDILVIADTEKPIALAGVMGGKDTEVTEATKNILLEAAVFNPQIVRRSRRYLEVQTDSSYRFERGIDAGIVEKASWQAVKLIEDLAGGECVLAKSSGMPKSEGRRIKLETPSVDKILGHNIGPAKIEKILKSLEFKIQTRAKNSFTVRVPTHRADVNLEIDLIEEIARIFGYENIPQGLPIVMPQVNAGKAKDLISFIKNILASGGLNEVITYSLMDKDLLRNFGVKQENEAIEILNPLSKEQEILRPRLMFGLARCIAYNLNQKQAYVRIIETAKVVSQSLTGPKEELMLGIGLCGTQSFLLEQGLIKEEVGFLHLKGILEALFGRFGIKEHSFTAANESEVGVYVDKDKIGTMVRLGKEITGCLDIKNKDVFVAELLLDKALSYVNLNKRFMHSPVYPGILRDISLILKEGALVGDVLGAIKEKGSPLLKEAKVIDYYKGKQIPSGFKGLTISCFYRADDRTLTEREIAPLHSDISLSLVEKFSAQIRA